MPSVVLRPSVVACRLRCPLLRSLRKAEIASITTQTNFAGFYDRLRAIREYHAKFPETAAVTLHELESGEAEGGAGGGAEFAAPAPVIHFSGEENFGRHLDMHALHERMLNMPDQVWMGHASRSLPSKQERNFFLQASFTFTIRSTLFSGRSIRPIIW
jgi:hypothetical protein